MERSERMSESACQPTKKQAEFQETSTIYIRANTSQRSSLKAD